MGLEDGRSGQIVRPTTLTARWKPGQCRQRHTLLEVYADFHPTTVAPIPRAMQGPSAQTGYREPTMTAPSRILVGVDGSVHAEGALRWATDLGAALGAEVITVHALGMLNLGARPSTPSHEHHEEVRGLLENEWTQALRSSGVSYRCLLVDGNPVLALMHVAEEQDAGLIVVGTRGAGGFPGLQLGNTEPPVATARQSSRGRRTPDQ